MFIVNLKEERENAQVLDLEKSVLRESWPWGVYQRQDPVAGEEVVKPFEERRQNSGNCILKKKKHIKTVLTALKHLGLWKKDASNFSMEELGKNQSSDELKQHHKVKQDKSK